MREELEDRLFERFDFFKPDRPMTEGLMCFGFECGDGWFDLIWNLCEEIEPLVKALEDFEVLQVKEKFGGLRFYVCTGWAGAINEDVADQVWDIIRKYEEKSYKTCENCGEAGKPTDTPWIRTLCPEHTNEYLEYGE